MHKPAEQHHGEPVAWLARAVDADGTTYRQCVSTSKLTERDAKFAWGEGVMNRCSVVITPLGPLADPGEAERLRTELEVTKKLYAEACQASYDFGAMQQQIDALRAQLAELDALLREVLQIAEQDEPIGAGLYTSIKDALSASAESSAQCCGACPAGCVIKAAADWDDVNTYGAS